MSSVDQSNIFVQELYNNLTYKTDRTIGTAEYVVTHEQEIK